MKGADVCMYVFFSIFALVKTLKYLRLRSILRLILNEAAYRTITRLSVAQAMCFISSGTVRFATEDSFA